MEVVYLKSMGVHTRDIWRRMVFIMSLAGFVFAAVAGCSSTNDEENSDILAALLSGHSGGSGHTGQDPRTFFAGPNRSWGTSLARSDNGFLYMAGETTGSFAPFQDNPGGSEMHTFLMRFRPGRNSPLVWVREFSPNQLSIINGSRVKLASGSDNSVVLFGPKIISDAVPQPGMSFLLAKFDQAGNLSWEKTFGFEKSAWTAGMTIADDDSVTIAGNREKFSPPGDHDAVLARYSPAGDLIWMDVFGQDQVANSITLTDLAQDSSGNLYILGHTGKNLSGGSEPLEINMMLRKVSSSGVTQWTRVLGTDLRDWSGELAVRNGIVYLTGKTYNPSVGYIDGFLAAYDMNGSFLWRQPLLVGQDGSGSIYLAPGDHESIYVAGIHKPYAGSPVEQSWIAKISSAGNIVWRKDLLPPNPVRTSAENIFLDLITSESGFPELTGIITHDLDGQTCTPAGACQKAFYVQFNAAGERR